MNWTAFGCNRRPFRSMPDTAAYFPASGHEAALAEIRDAFDAGDDGAILTGEPGIGKTILIHRFLEEQPDTVSCILLPSSKYNKPSDLYQAILFDLGQPWQQRNEQDLRLSVTEHFLSELSAGKKTILAIDEAHHLHVDVIEELRMLSNISKSDQRPLFALLAGLGSLRDRLDTPWLRAALQRYRIRNIIPAFSTQETVRYLQHQLEAAGCRDDERLIDRETAEYIAQYSMGIPRLANHIASTAMQLSHANESTTLDFEAVMEAVERLGLNQNDHDTLLDESEEELVEYHGLTSSSQSLQAEQSDESEGASLTIPTVKREQSAVRTPKQRLGKRQSA